jgi:hypothetical protein
MVYMGPAAHTPLLLEALEVLQKIKAIHPKSLSSSHPLTVVSRGERGQAALPAEGYSRRLHPILTAEPQYRSGTLKRSQFNACQFMGVTPPLLGLACFYGALE